MLCNDTPIEWNTINDPLNIWADGAQFQLPTSAKVDRKAVLARLSVWSPAEPSPKQPVFGLPIRT